EPRWVNLDPCLFTPLGVDIVGSVVPELEEICRQLLFHNVRRDRTSWFDFAKTRLDVVARRPSCSTRSPPVQPLHVLTVRLEYGAVIGFRPRGLREPPDVLNGVLYPDAAHGHPLRRHRHLRGVEPETFLRKVKARSLHQCHQK